MMLLLLETARDSTRVDAYQIHGNRADSCEISIEAFDDMVCIAGLERDPVTYALIDDARQVAFQGVTRWPLCIPRKQGEYALAWRSSGSGPCVRIFSVCPCRYRDASDTH